VIADSRALKDEQQQRPRHQDRDRGDDEDYFEDEFDRAPRHEQRSEPRAESRAESRGRRDEQAQDNVAEEGERPAEDIRGEGMEGEEYEPTENPFTRPVRAAKPRRPRKERAPKAADGDGEPSGGLDPSALPPAIGRDSSNDASGDDVEEAPAAPAPRRRRTTRARSSGGDQELEAVG
ncbi:MAG TPA: hypothetical protein VEZ26_10620, partial [Sphingomonadaceae bacterium]|nr:hypothetical protein [Sphingomonadaceae bacterium]